MNRIDYAKTAEYCKREWPELCEKVISIADDVCKNKFIFDMHWDLERVDEPTVFENEIDWFYKRNNDPEFLFQLNRHHFFISLANAYWLTGDEKYVKKLKALMLHWIETVPFSNHNALHPWRSLEIGFRGEYWTLAINIVKDCPLIDGVFLKKYHESLGLHAEKLIEFHSVNNNLSNWGVIQDHGLFDIGIELQNEEYIGTALSRLYRQADIQVMADGVHWEQSCLYHNEVLKCFLDVIFRARQNGIKLSEGFIKQVKKMAAVNAAWIKPNGKCPLLGDSDYVDIRDVLTQSALAFADPVLKGLGYSKPDFESVWLLGTDAAKAYESIAPAKPDFNSITLSDSGNYIMRSSFERDSNYLMFHNGYTGAGHAHEDKLSFALSIGENDIFTDCGRGTYVWGKARKFLKSYAAHNTIAVDGKHFIESNGWQYKSLAPSMKGSFDKGEGYEYVSGAHLGYLDLRSPVLIKRGILWIKPDIYLIIDEMHAKATHTYSQYFNFSPNGNLTIRKCGTVADFNAPSAHAYIKTLAADTVFAEHDSLYSDHYNDMIKTKGLKTSFKAKAETNAVTVIIANANGKYKSIKVEKAPVLSDDRKTGVSENEALGIMIDLDGEEHTVVLTFKETMKVLFCNEKHAAAKITWYNKNKHHNVLW